MTNHPVTPPPELVQQWYSMIPKLEFGDLEAWIMLAKQIYAAGADQELAACCEWMSVHGYHCGSKRMRNDRRPKPLSLKKQAIALIDSCADPDGDYLDDNALTTIRRALESIPDPS